MAITDLRTVDFAGEAQAAEAALHRAGSLVEACAIRARAHPDVPVLVDVAHGTRLTYGELDTRSHEGAGWLRAQGLGEADLLAIPLTADLTDVAVALLAAMKAGTRPMVVRELARIAPTDQARTLVVPGTAADLSVLALPAADLGCEVEMPGDGDLGDALHDEHAGRAVARPGAALRQVLAPGWPKVVPMLRDMVYSAEPASFASVLMWHCWRGRTGHAVAGESVGDLLDVAQAGLLPVVVLTKAQFREVSTGAPIGQDVTSVKEVVLTHVAKVSDADAARIAARFPQAAGIGMPALDGRLRLLGARTGEGRAVVVERADASASVVRSAPVPPLALVMGEVPGAYVELLISVLTRWVLDDEYVPVAGGELYRRVPIDRTARAIGRDWPSDAETMVGVHRLRHLAQCVATLHADGVRGDLVEAGAWRGGSCILMRGVLKALGDTARTVWAADSFQGFPAQDYTLASSVTASSTASYQFPLIQVGLEVVRRNFERYGLLDEQVRFVPGWFHETLPGLPVSEIALLRVDGDLYDSTWAPLNALYDRLQVGGFCIVDDYGDVTACREAVDRFRAQRGITEPIQWSDTDAVYWRKSR